MHPDTYAAFAEERGHELRVEAERGRRASQRPRCAPGPIDRIRAFLIDRGRSAAELRAAASRTTAAERR